MPDVQLAAMLLLTFRELWAKKITLGLFIVCTLVWVMLAFALNLDVVDGTLAGIRIFGQSAGPTDEIRNPETGDVLREALSLETVVIAIESFVAGAAYWAGTLLGLFATATLLPALLEQGRIDLMLSKPLSRTSLLAGHILGVLVVVLLLACYLLGMVWIVLSVKTGIWNARFLLAVGVVVAMFAVMYSVVALLGVATRSAPLALIAAYGLIFASVILWSKDQLAPQINPPWRQVFLGFYYVLPHFGEVTELVAKLSGADAVASWYPFVASLAFGGVLFAAAFALFQRRDF